MPSSFSAYPKSWQDVGGKPIVNGYVYIGTQNLDPVLNPVTLYANAAHSVTLANPQRTNAYGHPVNKIWVEPPYSYAIKDSDGVLVYQDLDYQEAVGEAGGMSLRILATGSLVKDPEVRISKDGRKYLIASGAIPPPSPLRRDQWIVRFAAAPP